MTLPPLISEQVLIELLPQLSLPEAPRTLVISQGRAQFAEELQRQQPKSKVQAWYFDLHRAEVARLFADANAWKLDIHCSADLPEAEFDLIAMPILKQGEAELTRELMQQSHQRLAVGGSLLMSVDHPRDSWLHDQMQALFDKVTVLPHERGRAYLARKTAPLKRERDFSCQFQYPVEGRLLTAMSRPGVFSHRRLDPGARQLINCAEIGPTDRVLDYGCGCGTVTLAAAMQTSGNVYAVDANARAIDCVRHNAELSKFTNVHAIWNCDGQLGLTEPIDIVLANPPYFGEHAIWQHFVENSLAQLRIGGALLVVTKHPNWFAEFLEDRVDELTVAAAGKYYIVFGLQPG